MPGLFFFCVLFCGQDAESKASEQPSRRDPKNPPEQRSGTRDGNLQNRGDLEREFERTMRGATLKGTWRVRTEGGELGDAKAEQYRISDVEKVGNEDWIIRARILVEGKDVSLPVPVRVLWAGDTPIITVDNAGLPGLGTYSARVMIHRDFYSGAWFGPNNGGVLSGQITREGATTQPTEPGGSKGHAEQPPQKSVPR